MSPSLQSIIDTYPGVDPEVIERIYDIGRSSVVTEVDIMSECVEESVMQNLDNTIDATVFAVLQQYLIRTGIDKTFVEIDPSFVAETMADYDYKTSFPRQGVKRYELSVKSA